MSSTLFKLEPRKTLLKDFYVFDTETIERNDKGQIKYTLRGRPENFAFGVVYGHNFSKVIHDLEEFKQEFLHPRYKNKKIFAHNATYDLGVLYGNIFELDPNAIFNGRFICCTNGNAMFCDSMNIFQTSAAKLGEIVGKKKLNISYNWKKEVTKNDINYCIRDCEIIYDALIEIFNEVGDVKITQASLSMAFYRRHYQPFNLTKSDLVSSFWDSYFGGRTEAFKIGKTNAHVIDLNSIYPYVMKKTLFPNPMTLKKRVNTSINYAKKIIHEYEGCIKCKVKHKDHFFGFLPVKKDGKLIFPIGEFVGTWNFNEIRFALKYKVIEIKEVFEITFSRSMESVFKSFVNDLYFKRLNSTNEFEKFRIKIFMNSLYGKFAQRIKQEEIYLHNIPKQWQQIVKAKKEKRFLGLRTFNETRDDGFLILKSKQLKSLSHSIPSFASYITSEARIILLEKLLELKKYRPVYCDTDSIFFEVMPMEFKSSKKLGHWKLENKIVTEIKGLKNYRYIEDGEEKRKLKGVPKNAIEVSENYFEFSNLVKPKEGLIRNMDFNIPIKRTKLISNNYDKRIIKQKTTEAIKL